MNDDRCNAILSHYTIPRTPLPRCVLPKGHGGTHERQKRTENGTDEEDRDHKAEATIATLTAQRDAAEKDRDEWKEAAIYEKDQGTQRMWDNLRLVGQRDAAEKVCEAAAAHLVTSDKLAAPETDDRVRDVDAEGEASAHLHNALTEWRRTKDANTGHSTQV